MHKSKILKGYVNVKFYLGLFALHLCFTAGASSASQTTEFLNLLQRHGISKQAVSFEKRQLAATEKDGKNQIITHQAHIALNPASTLKVLTSVASLNTLGAAYTFNTEFWLDTKENLYITGHDPSLVSEQLWRAVTDLHNRGYQHIKGDVVVDAFQVKNRLPTRGFDASAAYNTSLTTLSLNYNHLQVWVQPTSEQGGKPKIVVDPALGEFLQIRNRAKTAKGNQRSIAVTTSMNKDRLFVDVSGTIGSKLQPLQIYRSVPDARLYVLAAFRQLFESAGGTIAGKSRLGQIPADAKLIFTKQSHRPLSQVVSLLNKYSNNLMADQLVYVLGLQNGGPVVQDPLKTFEQGVESLRRFMKSHTAPPHNYQVVNGSGLSRSNRLSASQLNDILKVAYDDVNNRAEFIGALSRYGEDGTTKSWLNDRQRSQLSSVSIRVKTGSLKGVSALTGYVLTTDKEPTVFSFLVNQKGVTRPKMIRFYNDLTSWLAKTAKS